MFCIQETAELNVDNNTEASSNNVKEADLKENITHIEITESAGNDTINDIRQEQLSDTSSSEIESDYETAISDIDEDNETEDLTEKFAELKCNPTDLEVDGEDEGKHAVDDILVPLNITKSKDEKSDIDSIEDEDDDNDDNGWITPGKLKL